MGPFFSAGGMKSSHTQTPRTERDTSYWYGGDPYEDPPCTRTGKRWAVWLVLALLALSMIAGRV